MRIITNCLAVLCTALLAAGLTAQDVRPVSLIQKAREAQVFEETYALFIPSSDKAAIPVLEQAGADYQVFDLDAKALTDLRESAPDQLELTLPGNAGTVALHRADIYAPGFRVTESKSNKYTKAPLGLHYRGVVNNEAKSLVAISIFSGEVSGLIATSAGNLVLGKLATEDGRHVLYNERDLPAPDLGECATPDSGLPYSPKELIDLPAGEKDANNCVNLYLEADYSIYQQRGSTAAVTNFLTGLFNQVAVLYANESINLVLSELYVWNTQDPYNSTSSSGNLSAFRSNRTSFNGDIAHLVSFQASGGVAYVDVLCSSSYAYGFSSIDNNFQNVPAYSWSVNVLAHELGHNFGSQHTHACVWNGNNTAIDGCYTPQGSCAQPAGLPAGGGTIMSYCHLTSAGVNLNAGFGPQPGNLIRNRAYNGSCLTACGSGGGGSGGGGGTTCSDNVVTVTIRTDNYPGETSWTITSAGGSVVASGSGYSSRNTTYTTEACLPNGCYTFQINDTYGDGICCSYGNGAYTINVNGTDVATGGNFGTSTTEQFCGDAGSGGGGGGDGGEVNCLDIDFTETPPGTYGGSQDQGTVVLQNAATILIQNNAWKSINLDYTVTPATVIEFEFGSTQQGEIHGIGFDNDNSISSNRTFRLYGTQSWGLSNYADYTTPGYWKTYTIPVGQFYTGSFNRLFFTADHDGGSRNGNSFFRNISIYEGSSCVGAAPVSGAPIVPETQGSLTSVLELVQLFPNPAADLINVDLLVPDASLASVRMVDLSGRTIRQLQVSLQPGAQRLRLAVDQLPAGAYLLRIDAASGFATTTKFTVAR